MTLLVVADRVPKNTLISSSDISFTCGKFLQEIHPIHPDPLTMFKSINIRISLLSRKWVLRGLNLSTQESETGGVLVV